MLRAHKQEQDCFVASVNQSQPMQQNIQADYQPLTEFKLCLPAAKQLIPHYRPVKMQARVLTYESIYYQLPNQLNLSCQQLQLDQQTKRSKPSLMAKDLFSINEYIMSKELQLLYQKQDKRNKFEKQQINDQNFFKEDFTARIRNISQLNDFNQKDYRQLQAKTKNYFSSRPSDEMVFDSRFETGNLNRVYISKQKDNKNYGAYFLLLEKDSNTHGYTNWFHFKTKNGRTGVHRFFILNIVKRTSLYKQGMRISIFSMNKYKNHQIGWFKGGNNIHFFQTKFYRFSSSSQTFNCLYFQYDFQEEDEVYFASCQPYTYTRMVNNLQSCCSGIDQSSRIKFKIQSLGHTLCNNIIPLVKIFNEKDVNTPKDVILVMGRQHPSETAGSFISEYIIRYLLTSSNKIAKSLLQQFTFMIIPMVNPDGVILGNSRCNLAGLDLNRQWGHSLLKQFTPQTYRIKQEIINTLQANIKIKYVLDLHGHGKKLNSFFFCCRSEDRINNRIYPMVVSKLNSRLDLASCTYGISKDKECTIRAQLYDLKVRNTFTLQNSYFGYYDKKSQKIINYTQKDYELLAESLLESLDILTRSEKNEKQKILEEYGFNSDTIRKELERQIDVLQKQQRKNLICDNIMSDSDPEGDILKLQQRLKTIKNKKIANKLKQSLGSRASSLKKQSKKKKLTINKSEKPPSKKKQKKSDKKSECEEQDKNSDSSQSLQEKKLEGKLILSKRNYRTQQKFKQKLSTKVQTEKNLKQEKVIVKKIIGDPYSHTENNRAELNSTSISQYKAPKQTRAYDRARLFSRIKTEAIQVKNNLQEQIRQQQAQKQKIGQAYNTLRDQSLKAMMKESFGILGLDTRAKKCKRIQDYQQKPEKQQMLFHGSKMSFYQSANKRDEQKYAELRQKKSYSMLLSSEKRIMPDAETSFLVKPEEKLKYRRNKIGAKSSHKKYEKFQKFLQGFSTEDSSHHNNSVLYHFPVL